MFKHLGFLVKVVSLSKRSI